MADTDDTEPFDPIEQPAPWLVNRDDEEPAEAAHLDPRIPEPALVRAVIVAGVGLVGAVVGKQLDQSWVDPAIAFYVLASPIALGFWIRRHVSPVKK